MDDPISESDSEYLSDASEESDYSANMDVPISKIDVEYLNDATVQTSGEKGIPDYVSYRLMKEAQKALENLKKQVPETRMLYVFEDKGIPPECPEGYSENDSTIQVLVKFYRKYNEEWGTSSAKFQALERKSETRERILEISKAVRTALKMLTRVERGDTAEEVFILENGIPKEFLQDTEYETDNIIPFDGRTNCLPAEVEYAINQLELAGRGERDVLDRLEKIFKFQKSSVSNQRENIVNLLSNEIMRLGTPGEPQTAFNEALENVFLKTLNNYEKWCSYLHIEPIWENTDENAAGEGENAAVEGENAAGEGENAAVEGENAAEEGDNAAGEGENAACEDVNVISNEKKILYISLYYLIWGEAANVRFLPECLCYIFHHMSKLLDDEDFILMFEQLDVPRVSGSFIHQVIQPIYEVIAAEAKINSKRDAPHSTWRNYDDFNEYFWSPDCLQLGWPLNRDSPFFQKPPEGSTTVFGKTSFIEHRTFWHLYHSFHRMWIFHVIMFQALVIYAFNDEKVNSETLREILSVGPTYFLMKLIQSMLDIVLKDGAYSNTSRADVLRIRFRIICFMSTLIIFFVGIFRKGIQEKTSSSVEESIAFYACIVVLVIYACTITWINQLEEYVGRGMDEELLDSYLKEEYAGRGMDEKPTDYIKYMIFWIVTLAINFAFTYYCLIRPLVRPTRDITDASKNIHNTLAIGSLWAGVICAYIVGSHISYNVISAFVGTFVGHTERLGHIKCLGDVHKCFDKIPTAFMDHLHSRESPLENNQEDVQKLDAAGFSPFWNQIVMHLREEDYISDLEQYALNMPENSGSTDVIQWPPFLLVGKVSLAIKIAAKSVPQKVMWDEISRDVHMRYAVEECFLSVKIILRSVLNHEGKKWIDGIYEGIKKSIADDGNLGSEFQLNELQSFVKEISELIKIMHEERRRVDYKVLNKVMKHDFLGTKKIAKTISDFSCTTNRELISQIKRLHLLLTMDKSSDNVPRNREARRRLVFFTNSLFMSMPTTKPVHEMLSFSVLTPYYEETVLYSLDELESSNDDGVTLIDYLKNLYPDEWTNFTDRIDKRDTDDGNVELRLWASYRGQTLARTVRGTMYYQKALLFQAYRETLNVRGSGVDGLPSTSPMPDVSMDEVSRATLNSLEELSSRDELLVQTSRIMLRDKENYKPWREQMMPMLESENMIGFVDGSLRDPDPKGESQDEYVCNYSQKWKKLDKKVKDWIMASLNDILKNMVKKMKTAKELWETLEMFFSTDITSSVNVTDHVSINLLNKEHYRDWVSQMENFLQAKRMFCFIIGKFEDPDPKKKSQEDLVRIYSERWKELDKQVMKWIRDSLSESMYDSVKDSETAEQMWDALKEIIGSQSLNECLDEVKAHVDLKFTYVVSCQRYRKQKREGKDVAADIAFLLKRNEGLRVAFVDEVNDEYLSKLVKADKNGKYMEVYSIKLPGDPRLGEGKSENQNHAIVFTRGNAIQTIDVNQDNYFEETLKMRNLLEEFHRDHAIRPATILGIREHIFTGSASYLASFMSNQETSLVTLGQRVMAKPLNVRMHYGHSDVFDRVFHITRGGISKASRGINISEDIYAGFNSTLRNGRVTHHEYIQVGKGRDVGFNQIAIFEGKVAGGNGEQILSRDIYRLGQRFDFFRMLSFYYTSVGYYFSSLLMVITLYILLYGNLIMALSGTRVPHVLNDTAMTPKLFLMIVLLPAIYMLLVPFLEQGLEKAVESFLAMFFNLGSIFYAFSLGTRIHSFGRTVIHGGASYQATGRGFVLHHIKFSENFRRYSRSHFIKGMEVLFLVVVYIIYGFHSARALYNPLLLGGLILSISWIVAPFLFDSSPFDPNKNSEDWEDWNNWRNCKSVGVEESRSVQEGVPVDETVPAKKSVPVDKSWESWWNKELDHIRTPAGRVIETILSIRFFIFPLVVGYKLDVQGLKNSLSNCVIPWICLLGILFVHEFFSNKKQVIHFFSKNRVATICALAFAIVCGFISFFSNNGVATIGALAIAYYYSTFGYMFASIKAIITTVWGFLSFFSNNRVANIGALAIAYYFYALGDMLAFIIATITTVWGFLSICVAWKPTLERFNLWTPVMYLAWICDTGMGALIFKIANMFSQRSIKRYLVRNMFDQNISELLHKSSAENALLYGRGF